MERDEALLDSLQVVVGSTGSLGTFEQPLRHLYVGNVEVKDGFARADELLEFGTLLFLSRITIDEEAWKDGYLVLEMIVSILLLLGFLFFLCSFIFFFFFSDASTHLYMRVCLSVRPLVRPSVRPSFHPSVRHVFKPRNSIANGTEIMENFYFKILFKEI